MFKSFLEWLDEYLQREDSTAVVRAVVGLMGFAGLLGTVLGSSVVRGGGFVAISLFVISVILLLLADRRKLKKKYDSHRKFLRRYCDFIAEHHSRPLIRITLWKQVAFIQANGDVREILRINAVAERREVYFLRFRAGGGEAELSKRQQRRVKVNARAITVNGQRGPRWEVTRSWLPDGRLNSIVHFHEPVRRGGKIDIEIERFWPGKCAPLMREGATEPFTFRFTGLMPADAIEHTVVLPLGFSAYYDTVGFVEPDPRFSVTVGEDDESRRTFTFRGQILVPKKDFGMRLDVTKPASR
ncbi:hypothetical protein [Lentzea aerocolonigenes]|uniref:hypothetical protein n=1 Tax=Lentzea aerocolonigenes TaxID=68170 RepID=UPI000AF892FF|nr:hypothetical protein [Lentzea aerocolonigenes]MCP2245723.1 hypothetical protein [Lentzea aerocolonigenes]